MANLTLAIPKKTSEWSTNRRKKLKTAFQHGVATVLIIDGNIKNNLGILRRQLLDARMKMGEGEKPAENFANSIYISTDIAKAIIGKNYKKFVKTRKKNSEKRETSLDDFSNGYYLKTRQKSQAITRRKYIRFY